MREKRVVELFCMRNHRWETSGRTPRMSWRIYGMYARRTPRTGNFRGNSRYVAYIRADVAYVRPYIKSLEVFHCISTHINVKMCVITVCGVRHCYFLAILLFPFLPPPSKRGGVYSCTVSLHIKVDYLC